MKINGSINGGFDTKRAEQKDKEAKSFGESPKNARVGGDRVELSNLEAKAQGPEVPSQEKISRLKDAIANGELKINFEKIAERMMEEGR